MNTEPANSIRESGRRLLRVALSGIVLVSTVAALRAADDTEAPKPVLHQAVGFAESTPARDLGPAFSSLLAPPPGEARIQEIPLGTVPQETAAASGRTRGAFEPDAAVAPATFNATPGPVVSFDGLSSDDNLALFGFRVLPPDPNGDVGPAHYVQAVNIAARVYDKTGVPLTPAFKMSSLFAPLGGICSTDNDGDPIVLYDPLADRWMISQFAFTNSNSPPYHQCIAVSRNGDPTGAYYLYDFIVPGANFNDYPKFGVWPDAYYMTDVQFLNGGPFNGTGVFAFDRAKMLVGDPTAGFLYVNIPSGFSILGVLPSDFDGLNAPPPGSPNYLAVFTANEFSHPADALRVFEFHADFAVPASSTFAERAESPIAVAAFDPRNPPGRDDIEQPPPAVLGFSYLDSIQDRLMHRLAYRNFGTHESLVVTHTVNVGTGFVTAAMHQAGIRYYELRRSGGAFWVNEQATYAPDTDNRWMGSAAMDHQGNLAVGYSVSSLTTFPSIRYAGRLATDPPGGLFQGEATLIAGTGVQTSSLSRWGDYSAMTVDPVDDCTFWYTNEYYTAASQATSSAGWLTRIGNFKFPECSAAAQGTLQGTVTDCGTGLPLEGAVAQVSSGFSQVTDVTGFYSRSLAPGTYSVTYTFPTYTPATVPGVVIANGGITTQDVCLCQNDTQAPSVTITQPSHDVTGLPSVNIPINVAFDSSDNVGIAHEAVKLEACTLFDGDVYGDRDGLLSDEGIQINKYILCQAMARCGYTILDYPRLVVEASDPCGNTGSASRIIRRRLRRSEVCR